MGIVVELELFSLKCPVCNSKSTYHRKTRGNNRCRMCGSIFRAESPLDIIAKSEEVITHGRMEEHRDQAV